MKADELEAWTGAAAPDPAATLRVVVSGTSGDLTGPWSHPRPTRNGL